MTRPSYNPSGLDTKRPIFLRLMPDERREAERVAADAGISKSNLARQAYLKGLPLVCEELSLPPPSSGPFGGEADSASPSSSSES